MQNYYLEHYFNFENAGKFFLVAFLGLALVMTIIIAVSKAQQAAWKRQMEETRTDPGFREYKKMKRKPYQFIESFYEMVFSSTAVLLFLSLYYMIDARMPEVAGIWHEYQSIILLIFILMSVTITAWLDLVVVRLKHIDSAQKANVRLTSTIYVVLILLYIRFIYQDTNYNELILYFVTLAVGRFLYFDFTIEDFRSLRDGVTTNLPLLVLMGLYSGIVLWYGFKVQFLLKSNGVIVSTLIAHVFMVVCIVVLHKTKLVKAVV